MVSARISNRVRPFLIKGSLLALSNVFLLRYFNKNIKQLIHYDDYNIGIVAILLLILLFSSIDGKIEYNKDKQGNQLFLFGWLLCFVTMQFTAQIYHVREDYYWWGLFSLFIYPTIILVWKEQDKLNSLFTMLAHCMVIASYIFLVLNILLTGFIVDGLINSINSVAFVGLSPNPNNNGIVVIAFFTAALYLTTIEERLSFSNILSLAVSIMFAAISCARTTEIAMLAEFILCCAVFIKHRQLFAKNVSLARDTAVVIAVLVLSFLLSVVLVHLDRIDLSVHADDGTEYVDASDEVQSNETLSKLNEISSGRIVLWKAYCKKLTFAGRGNPKGPLWPEYEFTQWAHNNAIDIWYASGFLAFLGYVIWLLAGWIFIFRCLLTKSCFRKEYLLTILAFVGYFVVAMLEITIYPTNTGIVFLMYMTLAPIMFMEGTLKGE